MIRLKRVYDAHEPGDGSRILVERLWPRGLSKKEAKIDLWLKELAPSTELRRWFGHDPGRWEQFQQRYWSELENASEAVQEIRKLARQGTLTFLYAAHDQDHNSARALREFMLGRTSP